MKRAWPVLVWIVCAVWVCWWLAANPLSDGYQNEYLHIGNAYDLWGALVSWDVWHLRWYMYTSYWPWGFYAASWPLMAVLGPTRQALVLGNLLHLALLLWASAGLGRSLQAPLAPLLVVLCPGVFGALVRFEPNLADVAWVTAGVWALVDSRGLRSRGHVLAWGVCLGVGLMMDRLSVLFFLAPALLPLLPGADRRGWLHAGLGVLAAVLISGAYYREFFLRHTAELLSQAPVGEIDSAGTLSAVGGVLYYPLSLVDSQAGPLLGLLMVWGVVSALRTAWRGPQRVTLGVLLAAILPAVLFFTLVAKKQVYYTLPALGPLAVLAARQGVRPAGLAAAGGLWAWLALGWGGVPAGRLSGPWLPEAWVAPRHVLARPPTHQQWPLAEALALLPADLHEILVFSEDETLYEGFLVLAVREGRPEATIRGLTLDPEGCYEQLDAVEAVVWVGEVGGRWPSGAQIRAELARDHYTLSALPPLDVALVGAHDRFVEQGRWAAGDRELVVFRVVPPGMR